MLPHDVSHKLVLWRETIPRCSRWTPSFCAIVDEWARVLPGLQSSTKICDDFHHDNQPIEWIITRHFAKNTAYFLFLSHVIVGNAYFSPHGALGFMLNTTSHLAKDFPVHYSSCPWRMYTPYWWMLPTETSYSCSRVKIVNWQQAWLIPYISVIHLQWWILGLKLQLSGTTPTTMFYRERRRRCCRGYTMNWNVTKINREFLLKCIANFGTVL